MLVLLATLALAPAPPQPLTDARLTEILTIIQSKAGIPALAAAVVYKGKVIAQAAVGVRKWGDPTPVAKDDKFHVGSITKSMTATLVARLVAEKKLSWDSTPHDVFPELKDKMDPVFKKVTLRHLLSHRAGIPTSYAPKSWSDLGDAFKDQRGARYAYVAELLSKPTQSEPGAKYEYTNAGYVVAGAMAEKVMNDNWEALLKRYLFAPLSMKTAGFGPMGTPNKLDQPWQHRWVGGKPVPCPNTPLMDNPPILGPAGRVHCSIGDLAKYVNAHIQGEKGKSKLLDAETFKLLHTGQFGGTYGFGWLLMDRPWADGRAIFHNGSNNMNYAAAWMAPSREFGAVAASNCAGPAAEKAVDDAISATIRAMFPQ
jgi:CubicO group peptidase (beta-lactamase class C family)